jgi:hypothetical protein
VGEWVSGIGDGELLCSGDGRKVMMMAGFRWGRES